MSLRYITPLIYLVLLAPHFSYAQSGDNYGLDPAATGAGLPNTSLTMIAANIIMAILGFVGVIFLLLIIYGGFTWMFGAREGKEKNINKAKTIITSATVGMIIIIVAYSITYFLVNYVITATNDTAPAGPVPDVPAAS